MNPKDTEIMEATISKMVKEDPNNENLKTLLAAYTFIGDVRVSIDSKEDSKKIDIPF